MKTCVTAEFILHSNGSEFHVWIEARRGNDEQFRNSEEELLVQGWLDGGPDVLAAYFRELNYSSPADMAGYEYLVEEDNGGFRFRRRHHADQWLSFTPATPDDWYGNA